MSCRSGCTRCENRVLLLDHFMWRLFGTARLAVGMCLGSHGEIAWG